MDGAQPMMWLRLEIAYWLDLFEQRFRAFIVEPLLRGRQAWFQEFCAYLNQPRMTWWEMWVRYTMLRMDAESKYMNRQLSEAEAREFYTTHEYMMWRNLVHRRHVAWRRVTVTMQGRRGNLYEKGCGIAPVAAWVRSRRPDWHVSTSDLEGSAHLDYARWRVPNSGKFYDEYHVVTMLDVFEHLAQPLDAAQYYVKYVMAPGAYLHYNIHYNESQNDLDLATREQLDATARYLESVLEIVWRKGEYVVGRKR